MAFPGVSPELAQLFEFIDKNREEILEAWFMAPILELLEDEQTYE